MSEENWSSAGIDRLMRTMEGNLRKDPLDAEQEAAARRREQAKADRIAAALPGRLRENEEFLKRNVPDDIINERLARRRVARGMAEGREPGLPAQVDRERVEERLRFAREQLADRFGSELVKRDVDPLTLRAEWRRHVDGLALSFRERVRYEAEAEGRQLTGSELSHEEATRNAYSFWSEGVHGPSPVEIDRHIALAKENGVWPPPELHTGPGAKPRPHPQIYSYERFQQYCASPTRNLNADGREAGNLSAVNSPAEKPVAPIRKLQSARQPQFRMEPSSISGMDLRTIQQDPNNDHKGFLSRHGHPVPILRLQSPQDRPSRTAASATVGGSQAASREVHENRRHTPQISARQSLRYRFINVLKQTSRKIAHRISSAVSGGREDRVSGVPTRSSHPQHIRPPLVAVRYQDHQTTQVRDPSVRQAGQNRVTTTNIQDSETCARDAMVARRAAEPRSRSVYSR